MKKEQILESARTLFTKYGYKKVSMNEIAANANVTKKTVYSYFKDKDELFKYFIIEEIQSMKQIIEKNESQDLPFFEKIHKTIYDLVNYKKNAKLISQIANEPITLRNNSVIENLKLLDNSIQEYIKSKLIFAIDNKYIRPCNVDVSAFLIYKMYVALMYEWNNGKELDAKEVSDNLTIILKNGLAYKEEV